MSLTKSNLNGFFFIILFLSHLKAYCYSLWDSRWKMPHFFLLVMVIKCLSIDSECLNLTQKYLIINIFPFLPFVSSTLEKTPKRFLGGAKLICQFLAFINRKTLRECRPLMSPHIGCSDLHL